MKNNRKKFRGCFKD